MTHGQSDGGAEYDVVIAGGGTSGAALAGLLAKNRELRVCLIEAGPDYGPFDSGKWPAELLDGERLPEGSHSWDYFGNAHRSHVEPTTYDRARVIGGCSSHNGCIALLGHYRDYDHWVNLGNPGWAYGSVRPSFQRAMEALRVRQPDDEELTPFQAVFLGGSLAAGFERVVDLNHPGETQGVALSPVNNIDGVRWNTAFAYLDPVRDQDNLTIIDNALVDRIEFDGKRATGVVARRGNEEFSTSGDRVVLSAGAYGSPAILERSGVGDPDVLEPLKIPVKHVLPGVGKSLADHCSIVVSYKASRELEQEMSDQTRAGWCPDEQVVAKCQSERCDDAFDLHIYPISHFDRDEESWVFSVYASCVAPKSSGEVHITSTDPDTPPDIDHGYLTDPDGQDLSALIHGIRRIRHIMQPAIDSGMLTEEELPGPETESDTQLRDYIERNVGVYYHPACSCRMGPNSDQFAVVDSLGRVHGLENLWVCDASIFPTLMRANTNLPAAMVAEHLAPVIAAGR